MAAFASIMAFPIFNWVEDENPIDFMCIQIRVNGDIQSTPVCFSLYLNTQDFWDDEDAQGWAGAVQAAAVFGIFASAMGFMAFALLVTASCFPLMPRRLLSILVLQGVAALFSLLTLVAGAADGCEAAGLGDIDDVDCEKEDVRIETGAGFMIFAFFIYIAAGVMTCFYFLKVKSKHAPLPKEETAPFLSGTRVTVTKTILPGGETRIEKEYVDEEGQLVKEIMTEREEDEN
jgi:hypothetical protein